MGMFKGSVMNRHNSTVRNALSLTSNFPLAPERTLCDWDTIRQNEKHQYLRQCCLVSLIYRNQNRS